MSKIRVRSKSDRGFRRAGMQFLREGVELLISKLEEGVLELLKSEPQLIVEHVDDKPAKSEKSEKADPADSALLGSETFPALIQIGETEVPLGELVGAAFTRSGLASVKEWNALKPKQRDKFIAAEIDARVAALGDEPKK